MLPGGVARAGLGLNGAVALSSGNGPSVQRRVDGDGYSRWVVLARLVVAQAARLGEEANDECTDSVRGWKRRGWPGVAAMESGSVCWRGVY